MTVRVFMKVKFDDHSPLTEIKDIIMSGEFFADDVTFCEVIAEKPQSCDSNQPTKILLN